MTVAPNNEDKTGRTLHPTACPATRASEINKKADHDRSLLFWPQVASEAKRGYWYVTHFTFWNCVGLTKDLTGVSNASSSSDPFTSYAVACTRQSIVFPSSVPHNALEVFVLNELNYVLLLSILMLGILGFPHGLCGELQMSVVASIWQLGDLRTPGRTGPCQPALSRQPGKPSSVH